MNQTVYRATILQAELEALAVAAVAAKAGIDTTAPHIKTRAIVTTRQEGGLCVRRTVVEVELIDQHEGKPWAAIEHPADGSVSPPIVGDGSGEALPEVQG
jgi:hypothetical protein